MGRVFGAEEGGESFIGWDDGGADGHELVFNAGAKDFGGLGEDSGDMMKTGNVVLVVLEGVEWDRKRQVGEAGVDAILLVNWHLVLFEVVVGDALPENTNKEVVRELVLVGEPGGRDSFEPGQEGLVGLVELGDGIE